VQFIIRIVANIPGLKLDRLRRGLHNLYLLCWLPVFTSTVTVYVSLFDVVDRKMAEDSNLPNSENLNTKNGNFICGVVEGEW
jgi:hypothetical protein